MRIVSLMPLPCLQASFRSWAYAIMAFIFTITTPVGIAIGIGIQSTYNANSVTALVVSGVFDSVSTGERSLQRSAVDSAGRLYKSMRLDARGSHSDLGAAVHRPVQWGFEPNQHIITDLQA